MYNLFKNIFVYKCSKCDEQRGIIWKTVERHQFSSGHNTVYTLECDNCHHTLLEEYQSSPRVEVKFEKRATKVISSKEKYECKYDDKINDDVVMRINRVSEDVNRKTKDSYCLYSLLQNMVLLQHGVCDTYLETMSAFFDLPTYSTHTVNRDKRCAASIFTHISNKAMLEARRKEKNFIKNHKDPSFALRQSADGAYANRARMKSKYCYMYLVSHAVKLVTDYDVLCILKHDNNVELCGSRGLEHKLAEKIVPKSLERVDKYAVQYDKHITLETVGDKDIEWTKICESLKEVGQNTNIVKIDDVNHVLGRIYDCVDDAKLKIPKEKHRTCGLSVNFADHLYRSVHKCLISKPDSFCWDDMVKILDHYFAGNDHSLCPKQWCPVLNVEFYAPALARGKYLNKSGGDKLAYDSLKAELRAKFPDEQFIRIHGLPRSNENECLHSMACKKFSKATRPPCFDVFQGIVACTAAQKNWGRGHFLYEVLKSFGALGNEHLITLNRLQRTCISNWYRGRCPELKIKRASAKKAFMETQAKRNKFREKKKALYKKNIDKATARVSGNKRNRNKTLSTNVGPRKKKQKYSCPHCEKQYTYKGHYYNKHVNNCDKKSVVENTDINNNDNTTSEI